jgi:hypothetical protein
VGVIVDTPQGPYEFPSQREADAYLAATRKGGPSVQEDIARALPGVVPKATAGLAGLPQGIVDLGALGVGKASEALGGPSAGEVMRGEAPGQHPLARLTRGIPNIGGLVREGYDRLFEAATGAPMYKPVTKPGKLADEFLQGVVTGGTAAPARKVVGMLAGGGGGLGGEMAAQAFGDEPTNRVLGSLAGGFVGGMIEPVARTGVSLLGGPSILTPRVVAEHARKVTPAEWDAAKRLMEEAKAKGVNLTAPQAMPRPTPLLGLQERLTHVEAAAPEASRFLTAQTPAAAATSREFLSSVSGPPSTERIHEAALKATKRAEDFRAAVTAPEYAASRDRFFRPELHSLRERLKKEISAVGPTTDAGLFLTRKVLSRIPTDVMKHDHLKTILQGAQDQIKSQNWLANKGYTEQFVMQVKQGLREIEKTLARVEHNRPAGHLLHGQITEDIIKPQQAGLIGQISGKQEDIRNLSKLTSRLSGLLADENKIKAQSILEGAAQLRRADPAAFPQLVRMALEKRFTEAFKEAGGFADPRGPAHFAASVYGTAEQTAKRENFRAMMAGVAQSYGKNPKEVAEFVRGAERTMEILAAAGRGKGGIGASPGISGELPIEQIIGRGGIGMNPTLQLRTITGLSNMVTQKAYKEILDLFTAGPEGIDKIRSLASWQPARSSLVRATGAVAGTELEKGK